MKSQTIRQYQSFDKAFAYFNKKLFDARLPTVMLIHSRSGRNRGGHFWRNKWEKGGQYVHEISINPEYTANHSDLEVCSVLVHEMTHLEQELLGTSSSGGYHNKAWGKLLIRVGLRPSNTGKPGGKQTGFRMSHYVIKGGKFEIAFNEMPKNFLLPFTSTRSVLQQENEKDLIRKRQKTKVCFKCDSCNNKLWGKSSSLVFCGFCGRLLRPEGDHNNSVALHDNNIALVFNILRDLIRDKADPRTNQRHLSIIIADRLFELLKREDAEQGNESALLRLKNQLDAWSQNKTIGEYLLDNICWN